MTPISFLGITKKYGSKAVVDNLSLEIAGGELISLLGPSGCGKTTSLRMLAGFITPDGGDIQLEKKSILPLGPELRPTAMVFQRYTLWGHMNVFHNVAFGLKLRKVSQAEIKTRVAEMLELVGLAGYETRMPSQLSGGQQQRIALARALVVRPQVLLLDEPLSSLDARLRVALRDEIKSIQRRLGITTVFVTHDQEEALAISDRIAVMNEGLLHQVASPSLLYAQPKTLFAAQFIGSMNFLPAIIQAGKLRAGAFELPVDLPNGEVMLAIRPEDLVFTENGMPAQIEQQSELGHYRSLEVRVGQEKLVVFAARGATQTSNISLTRAVIYRQEQFLSEVKAVV